MTSRRAAQKARSRHESRRRSKRNLRKHKYRSQQSRRRRMSRHARKQSRRSQRSKHTRKQSKRHRRSRRSKRVPRKALMSKMISGKSRQRKLAHAFPHRRREVAGTQDAETQRAAASATFATAFAKGFKVTKAKK